MGCAYCGGYFDPYSLNKETDAKEEKDFETTVFTCPQCGGELYSTDQDATSFFLQLLRSRNHFINKTGKDAAP